MAAADLRSARAQDRRRIEAKARGKAASSPRPHRHWQHPATPRTYGNYQMPGPGHPAGHTVDNDDLED